MLCLPSDLFKTCNSRNDLFSAFMHSCIHSFTYSPIQPGNLKTEKRKEKRVVGNFRIEGRTSVKQPQSTQELETLETLENAVVFSLVGPVVYRT